MHYSREARLTIPVHAEPGGGTKLGAGENMAVEGHGKTHCGPNDTEKSSCVLIQHNFPYMVEKWTFEQLTWLCSLPKSHCQCCTTWTVELRSHLREELGGHASAVSTLWDVWVVYVLGTACLLV